MSCLFSGRHRWRGLIAMALAMLVIATCSSEDRICTVPEPKPLTMAYAFRQAIPICEACDPCWELYWYFECTEDSCRYIAHFDPREDQEEPDWLLAAHQLEPPYLGQLYGPPDTSWGYWTDPAPTPRDNLEAEEAALSLSGSLVAPQKLYDLVLRDLGSIRSQYGALVPEVSTIKFQSYLVTNELLVDLWPAAYLQFERGNYHDLDSLNARYRVTRIRPLFNHWIVLTFEGRYFPPALARVYEKVPSVFLADCDGYGFFCEPSTVVMWRKH